MTTNFEEGSLNGRSDSAKAGVPQARPKGWVPSRAANRDDIDATMDAIVRDIMDRDRKRFPRERSR